MKGRVIVIDMPKDRPSQAALVVDGRLEDLLIDPPHGDTTPKPGEIYWAKVDRVTQGGAFVKLTPDHHGFLRDTKGIKQGEARLVQITSYAEPGKATPATTRLLYKGRRVIFAPTSPGISVSRQIKDEDERQRLRRAVENWNPQLTPEELLGEPDAEQWYRAQHAAGGFIIRTSAKDADEAVLALEVSQAIAKSDMPLGVTRTCDPPRFAGNGQHSFDTPLIEWLDRKDIEILYRASAAAVVEHWRDSVGSDYPTPPRLTREEDPFDQFGVWDEVERLRTPRADLPSGGWMAIEATRAIVTVDVNTGDGFGTGDAMTANIEAARELPRQLRLRGLGGQVIIDFAPLKKQHRKKIEETLKTAFRRDPIDTTLAGWTPLGNFELQRKRERRPLSELL